MENSLKLKLVTSAIIAAIAQMSSAYADEAVNKDAATAVTQDAATVTEVAPIEDVVKDSASVAESGPLNLDKIVVTGSANKISKMKSSVSISTLNAEQVKNTGATNSAEVIRNIPGMRSEASGGESNFNLTSRGLPISAGGARYVQLQEDGLPITQIGDLNFGTPDTWLRIDQGLDKLEVIRGGSGSTLATSAPGGIVNFISQTGEKKGGKVGFSTGVNFKEYRTDFSYGGPIDDSGLRGFVSGFYRSGEGVRDFGSNMAQGGQIKGNITKELDRGYVRVSFKYLDDKTPAQLRVPTIGTGSSISEIAGINPRTTSFYDLGIVDTVRTRGNGLSSKSITDGVQAQSKAIGAEFSYDFDGWVVSDKFRWQDNAGNWIGVHSTGGPLAADNTTTMVVFNTKLHDFGLTANDAKLSKAFDLATAGKFTPTVGLYTSLQNVSSTWSFNAYRVNPIAHTATFLNNSTDQWGNCCTRDLDVEYQTIAPYAAVAWEIDSFNFDASVRHDKQDVTGYYVTATANPGGATSGTFDSANRRKVDYSIDHTSYSAGVNYRINPNLAVFGRVSNGVAFNGDRIMFGSANLNGGKIPINEADQYEIGVKWRQGNFNTFITLFQAKVNESNFDASNNTSTTGKYDNKGIEVEAGYSVGDFRVNGGFTYTDAKQLGVPSSESLLQRQAKWIYQLSPSYRFNEKLTLVGNLVGTSSSKDNGIDYLLPGYAIVNAGVKYDYDKHVQLSLTANNLFDTIGYTEADSGGYSARSVDGRAVRAAVVYSF